MQNPANMSLLGNVTWAISNLCRGKPAPDMALVAPAIEPLAALLHKEVSVGVLVDAVWALSYLSDGPNERIERVMQTGVTAKLVEFLEDKTSLLLIPTIRCLGNFVTGNDAQTQAVLDAGILNHLSELLDSPRRTIRKESCWLASNILCRYEPTDQFVDAPGRCDATTGRERESGRVGDPQESFVDAFQRVHNWYRQPCDGFDSV